MSQLDTQVSITTPNFFTAGEFDEFLAAAREANLPLNFAIVPEYDAETGEFSLAAGTVLQSVIDEVTAK